MSTGPAMPDKASNAPNGRQISGANKDSSNGLAKSNCEETARKLATSRTRPNQDVIMTDHNNNNDKNITNLAGPTVARLQASETSTSSTAIANKILGSNIQQPTDKMTASAECYESRNDSSSQRSSSTVARFKEKRPEPLKLNPNINQEIPLDLSVKRMKKKLMNLSPIQSSAGNMPSGVRGNIFNLSNVSQMATLDTPRIQWQDNESFLSLSKSRLFSSSTSAGQRVRMSVGDSPPITPNSPIMDLIASPSRATTLRLSNQQTNIQTSFDVHHSPNQMICSPLEISKFQILDKITRTNKSLLRYHQLRNEIKGAPRRSCSTDNLDYLCTKVVHNQTTNHNLDSRKDKDPGIRQQDQESSPSRGGNLNHSHINDNLSSKKNAISPLATKSLSSTTANSESGRFSYGNQQIAAIHSNEDQKSPKTNKAVTPTSVANAAANLSNINLNSPTRHQDSSPSNGLVCETPNMNLDQQIPPFHQASSFSSLSELLAASQRSHTEPSPLDPLLSAAYCQQNRHTASGSSQCPDDLQNHNLRNDSLMSSAFSHQNQTTPSFSSLTTLNTPTIISPSQLRAGNICFLPSPTLSPMSSVFELPSPLLVFSQNSQQMQSNSSSSSKSVAATSPSASSKCKSNASSNNQRVAGGNTSELEKPTNVKNSSNEVTLMSDVAVRANQDTSNFVTSESDLSSLITPAQRKVVSSQPTGDANKTGDIYSDEIDNEVVQMDIVDNNEGLNIEDPRDNLNKQIEERFRPATTIPEIYITTGSKPARVVDSQDTGVQNENHWNRNEKSNPFCTNQRLVKASCPLNASFQVSYSSQHINASSTQRDITDKRALSPNSLRSRNNLYPNERHGSSSAPPDVNQLKARPKVKTIEAWSYNELTAAQNKEQPQQTNHATNTTLAEHNNRFLQQRNGSYELTGLHHQDTESLHQRLSCQEVNSGFLAGSTQSTPYVQTHNASHVQVNSQIGSTNADVAKPIIEGRSSSAEPSGSYSSRYCRASLYNIEPGTAVSQLPLDYHGVSHSTQQLQQNGFPNSSQARLWNGPAWGSQQQQQQQSIQSQQTSHLVADPAQRSTQQQHHSISASEINRISDVGNMTYSRSQQQLNAQPPLFKPDSDNTILSHGAHGYGPMYQQRLQQNYLRSSMNELDNLLNHSQTAGANVNLPMRNSLNQKRQNAPFIGTTTANCTSHPIESNLFCSSDWMNTGEGGSFVGNVVNLNTNNHGQNMGRMNSLKSSECDVALASVRLCSRISPYNMEAENHSEPSESNSLDFCSLSGPGSVASRSSSAASSNMTAKKYHCEQCSKSFTRSDMLTRHKRLHSGDRPFQCSECKQEFSRSDHLSTHMRTHTGEKPYRCKLCSYSACRKDMITRHMKVHNRSQTSINTLDSL